MTFFREFRFTVGFALGVAITGSALAQESAQEATGASPVAPVLTLQAAMQEALRNNRALRAAAHDIDYGKAYLQERRADYLPNLTGQATAAGAKADGSSTGGGAGSSLAPRITAGALNVPTVLDRAAAGVTLTQLVTDFGRTDNLVDSAKDTLASAQSGFEDRRQQLLLVVQNDYYRALQAQATLEVTHSALNDRQRLLDQVSLLRDNKLKSDLDVGFASVAFAQAKLLDTQARSASLAAFAELTRTLGRDRPDGYRLVADGDGIAMTVPDIEALVRDAVSGRPEIQRLRNLVEAADHFARAQKDLQRPTINLVGAAGITPTGDPKLPDDYYAGGINLSLPLFTGGRLSAQAEEAKQRYLQAKDSLQDAEFAVARDVRVAALNLQADADAVDVSHQLRDTARNALELATSRYQLGISSTIELDAAQLNALNAELQWARARYDYRIAEAELKYRVGTLGSI